MACTAGRVSSTTNNLKISVSFPRLFEAKEKYVENHKAAPREILVPQRLSDEVELSRSYYRTCLNPKISNVL